MKKILKFRWNSKKILNDKSNHEQNEQTVGIQLPAFKIYFKFTVMKTAWYWYKNRHKDKWSRMVNLTVSTDI
jgi:hypothetical protein